MSRPTQYEDVMRQTRVVYGPAFGPPRRHLFQNRALYDRAVASWEHMQSFYANLGLEPPAVMTAYLPEPPIADQPSPAASYTPTSGPHRDLDFLMAWADLYARRHPTYEQPSRAYEGLASAHGHAPTSSQYLPSSALQ